MAVGVIQAAQALRISIPDDLAVIGYDNIDMGEYVFPKLSTIDQPAYLMGNTSWKILSDMMESNKREHQEVEFVPKLITRQSTMARF
jgi:LacI family transcriptional regulator